MAFEFTAKLPSLGQFYDGKLPDGQVLLKPMGEAEESLLFQAGADMFVAIHRIIDNCYLSKDKMPSDELLITDRLYLLFMLRVQMFGADYKVPFRCTACNRHSEPIINLVDEFNTINPPEDATEPFMVELPNCGKIVEFRALRGKDEMAIHRFTKRELIRDENASDRSARLRIAYRLVTVNGEPVDLKAAEKFALSLSFADAQIFRKEADRCESGIDPAVVLECPYCGNMDKHVIQLTPEFFQPNT